MHGINKIFLSSVVNSHKVSSDLIAKLNLEISDIRKSNRFHFIDNSNISMNFLYKDGLTSKKKFFTQTHIPSKHTAELEGSSLNEENKELSEMESFRNIRKKDFKNPLMGYLNINSLRNKIVDLREIVKYLELDYLVISQKLMKAFYHSSLLWRLGQGKIGTVMGVVC